MEARRTLWMTLVAALSLFAGVSGLIGSTAMISDGLSLTRIGAATSAPTVGTTGAPPPTGPVNGTVVAFGAIRGILSVLLLVGAVGTLWVRPSGRRWSLVFAMGWIVLGAVEPFALHYRFGWPVVTSALYPFLLLALFNSPSWRTAFAQAHDRKDAPSPPGGRQP
jgi:hypothetical protein